MAPMYFASNIDTSTRLQAHHGYHIEDQSPPQAPEYNGSPSHGGGRFRREWQAQNSPKVFPFVYERSALIGDEFPKECDKKIEYHDGANSITILSDALGRVAPIRLVQSVVRKSNIWMEQQREIAALDDEDVAYLYRKGTFTLPGREIWWVDRQIQSYPNADVREML